jgi:manganese/zinc/iron transport system substrate-binding protein
MIQFFVCALATAAAALFLVGCETPTTAPGNQAATKTYQGQGPLKIVCTTGMVADLVKNIAGERAEVTHLMGAGVDPHLYKSSPGDIQKLSAADVVFYSGLHLEGKMTDLFEQLATTKPVVPVADGIDPALLLDDGGLHDPHVWFNVMLWQHAAGKVEETLYKFDPKHADEYDQRHIALTRKLQELDKFCKDELAKIPADRRVLVTAHDAFRYFGKAYGIEVRGIQGVSTDSEAGVKQINELVNFLVQRKIKAIFVETSVSEQNVKSLLEGCKAQAHDVVIGGELFSDAMGEDGTPEGTYEGMIRHNVSTIVKSLQ